MEIIIIHGDYLSKSYERLQKYIQTARNKNWEVINIEYNPNINITETLSLKSLFSKERIFVLTNPTQLSKKDFSWLAKNIELLTGYLVIYNDDILRETFIGKLPKVKKVELFKLPQNIFIFLNSFYPGNYEKCLFNLHKILKEEKPEFIFFLLAKHLKDLYWSKISPSDIPYPSWRVDKLEKQSSKFSSESLKEIINALSDIDIKSKTSQGDLIELLDLLILRRLE